MTAAKFQTVNRYIASKSAFAQKNLQRARTAIKKALPGAEESISYNLPTYKLNGEVIIYFAAWKQHFSIYPADRRTVAAFAHELNDYEVGKGTIRFPFDQPVPAKLIGQIAKFRAALNKLRGAKRK